MSSTARGIYRATGSGPNRVEIFIGIPFNGGSRTLYQFPEIKYAKRLFFCGYMTSGGLYPEHDPATTADYQAGEFMNGDLLAVYVGGHATPGGQRVVFGQATSGSTTTTPCQGASIMFPVEQVDQDKWKEVHDHYVCEITSERFSSMELELRWAKNNLVANWASHSTLTAGKYDGADAYQCIMKFAVELEPPAPGSLPYNYTPHRNQGLLG